MIWWRRASCPSFPIDRLEACPTSLYQGSGATAGWPSSVSYRHPHMFFLNGVPLLDKPAVAPTCQSAITFETWYSKRIARLAAITPSPRTRSGVQNGSICCNRHRPDKAQVRGTQADTFKLMVISPYFDFLNSRIHTVAPAAMSVSTSLSSIHAPGWMFSTNKRSSMILRC
jgi:hypothetical protein